jgi:hypothetical protein
MINPMKIMELRSLWDKFQNAHPKFPMFLKAMSQNGIHEGTIIDITIQEPNGEKIQSNLKITAQDMELFEQLKQLSSEMQ